MIDWSRIAELRDEVGVDDLAEVVVLFCEEVEETLVRMSDERSSTLAEDLHFLKGSALNIGMSEVARFCQEAEASSRDLPCAPLELSRIQHAFETARQAIFQDMGVQI